MSQGGLLNASKLVAGMLTRWVFTFDIKPYSLIYCLMKTTVDLPDSILERTKIAAARRRTSIKNLIIEGLETVLREEIPGTPPDGAITRLEHGYHLGGKPLTRDQIHAR